MKTDDREFEILEHIYENPENIHQRDLARIVGLSLGMTNAILKRLAQKGLLKIRKVNNRNIRYIVSARGVEAIAHRSYGYLRRTIRNVVFYRHAIERLMRRIRDQGYDGLSLVGSSELDFIVEHACTIVGIRFVRNENEDVERVFSLYSENYARDQVAKSKRLDEPMAFLQEVLMAE